MLTSFKKTFLPIITYLGKGIEKRRFTQPPVFVGGCGRSGTTLLLSILSSHKEIFCIPGELSLFMHSKDKAGNPIPTRMDRLYSSFIKYRIPKSSNRWCEKTPRNIHHLDQIDHYFNGNFRFIQIIRDGRDVILSRHPTTKDKYWVSPERWIKDVSAGLEIKNHPKVHTLKYEDLILDFENSVAEICSFLEIELSKEILNWHSNATVTRNNAYFTKVQQISDSSIGKWKESKNEKRVEELTGDPKGLELLKSLGYY